MRRWEDYTEDDRIAAGEAAHRIVSGPDWKQSLGPWIESRVQSLQDRIAMRPIGTEEERRMFHEDRQELVVWKALLRKPKELITNTEGLLRDREGTQGEVENG